MNVKRLWWLASYPKSGNTFVRMWLNAALSGFPVDINTPFQYVCGDLQAGALQSACALPLTQLDSLGAVYFRPAMLLNFLYTSHTHDRTLKTHSANVTIDGIPMIPERLTKGAIYIIRDPRDVAVSFADHCGISIDQAIGFMAAEQAHLQRDGDGNCHILTSWSQHVESWTAEDLPISVTTVRYEDLVNDPDEAFKAVVAGLGLDVPDERFAFAMEQTRFQRLQAEEAEHGFRERKREGQFFRKGQANGWETADSVSLMIADEDEIGCEELIADFWGTTTKTPLTDSQRVRIERDHGEQMKRFDYL